MNITASYGAFNIQGSFEGTADTSEIQSLGTGLKGEYFTDKLLEPEKLKGSRIDSQVLFDWSRGQAPLGVGDYFSSGGLVKFVLRVRGLHFRTRSDDGIRVWVNGVLLVDEWSSHAPRWDSADQTISLVEGEKYDIKIEFFENAGHAVAELYWETPTISREVVVQEYLYPAD